MKTKILLAAPNSIFKNYCFEDWILNTRRFNVDIFIADNSPKNSNKNLYKKHGVKFTWINPYNKNSRQFICDSQNAIRNYFLKGDYTHLFFLETDLFPPRSILSFFETLDLPVVAAPYFIYKNRNTIVLNQEIRLVENRAMCRNYSLYESFITTDGNLKQCYSAGFGCMLIRRDVIELLPFRVQGISNTGEGHSDSFFYADLQMNKIPAYVYTGIMVRHYNSDWNKLKLKL